MLASILAALALGASSAIAAPAPLPHVLSSADLANPVVERIVGTVACEKVHTGTLTLVGPKTHSVNAGYDGYRNQNGLQVLVTAKADIPTPAQQFEFRACNSSFMGYTEIDSMAADVYYG